MKFILLLIIFLALVLGFSFIPVSRFKPWMDWWKQNTDPNDSASRNACFPMRLLAFDPYPNFMYDFADLFTWESKRFRHSFQARCLLDLMRTKAVGFHPPYTVSKDAKGDAVYKWVGVLTPHSMCFSIEPVPGTHKEYCDMYRSKMFVSCKVLKDMEKANSGYPDLTKWQKVDDINVNDGLCGYPYEILGRARAQYSTAGLGPFDIWRAFLWIWGARGLDLTQFECKLASHEQKDRFCYDKTLWDVPENFLYSWWQIPVDSAIVRSFVIQRNVAGNNDPIYPEAMPILLGNSGMAECGGWYGYVRSAGNFGDFDSDGFYRAVWADEVVFTDPNDPSLTGGPCALGGVVGTAGSAAVAGALIGGMIGGPIGAPIGFLVGLLGGGGAQVFSQHCDLGKNFSQPSA
jgi:hypothetical protein